MIIPNEILAHFNVSKRDESSDAGCFIKISAAEAKKNNLEPEVDVAEKLSFGKKPKVAPSHNGKVAKRGWGAGGIFVARRKISDEEWERYKKNAARIGNPLSEKEADERKRARTALVNKYGNKSAKMGCTVNGNPKPKRKPKTIRRKTPTVKLSAYSYARSKTRERIYGTRKAIVMTKQLQKTFPNIFDRQAMK